MQAVLPMTASSLPTLNASAMFCRLDDDSASSALMIAMRLRSMPAATSASAIFWCDLTLSEKTTWPPSLAPSMMRAAASWYFGLTSPAYASGSSISRSSDALPILLMIEKIMSWRKPAYTDCCVGLMSTICI